MGCGTLGDYLATHYSDIPLFIVFGALFAIDDIINNVAQSSALPENETFPSFERMARERHPLRDWVIGMLRSGALISAKEGGLIASVPRQTVGRWIREAEIDVGEARRQYLARNQRRAQRYVDGKPPRGKPSKRYLRRIAAKALKDFNRAQSKRVAEATGRDPH